MKKDEILRKPVKQEDPAAYIARWFILSLLLTVLLELPVIWLENRFFIPPLLRILGERTTDVGLTELLVQAFRLAVSLLLGGAETSVFTSSFSILIALAMAVLLLLPVLAVGWIFSRRIDAYVRQLQEARDADRDSYEKQRNLLISDMAHDLRTPVMSISAMAQALADDMVPPESRQEYYRGIISKSGKMGELITLLLDYVKLDSQGFALQREKTDLTRLVLEETADFYPAAEEAGMEVDADIPEEACMIEADRKQLGRVIANLLINAVRHNPPGTGICVSVSRRPGIASVIIADNGSPIEGDPEQLFQPFTRGDPARSPEGGSGLGLSIADRIARMHGYKLELVQPYRDLTKAFVLTCLTEEE